MRADGAPVERLVDVASRPLVSVFLPDRLELVKGPPSLRRAHLDQFVAALWPARRATRRAYSQALAQRNALLARVRAGRELAHGDGDVGRRTGPPRHRVARRPRRRGRALSAMASRRRPPSSASPATPPWSTSRARARPTRRVWPRSWRERLESDLERGFTGHGPHRDDLSLARDGRELRVYGSQGEQRLALLALLLAEREVIAVERGARPLLLLDDVMSELDADRRALLVERLAAGGQSVVTTTDLAHVPGADGVPAWRASRSPATGSWRRCASHEPRGAPPQSAPHREAPSRPSRTASRRPRAVGGPARVGGRRRRRDRRPGASPRRSAAGSSRSPARPPSGRRSSTS